MNKYLAEATKSFPECKETAKKQDFDSIISKTIKSNRKSNLGREKEFAMGVEIRRKSCSEPIHKVKIRT